MRRAPSPIIAAPASRTDRLPIPSSDRSARLPMGFLTPVRHRQESVVLTRRTAQLATGRLWPGITRFLTPRRVRLYPALLLAVTVAVYGVGLTRARNWIEPNGRIIGHDYFAFYMAGDMINTGRPECLYDLAAQSDYQHRWMADINPAWTGTCLFLNPPHYAWLMAGLARLGYGPSLLVWTGLSLVAFALTVCIWRSWIGPGHIATAVLLAICVPPWFWTLAGGQNSFFSLLILTGFCALLMTGRDARAGLVLSLLGFKFQLIGVPAGLLLLKRRWRGVAGLAAGTVFTLAFTALVLGRQSLADYVAFGSQLGRLMQVEGFEISHQHSWSGFFALLGQGWLPAGTARLLAVVASLASFLPLFAIWRGPWQPPSARFAWQLSALMMAALLVSPHLFHYDMLLALLPAMLWVRAAHLESSPHRDEPFRAWLAVGFVWLAVSSTVAATIHVQLSPLFMLGWILAIHRGLRRSSSTRAAFQTPGPRPRRPTGHHPVGPQNR